MISRNREVLTGVHWKQMSLTGIEITHEFVSGLFKVGPRKSELEGALQTNWHAF